MPDFSSARTNFTIPGLRDIGSGASEAQHKQLEEMRQQHKVQLWSEQGTEEQCEESWRKFLLDGTPDWVIYAAE